MKEMMQICVFINRRGTINCRRNQKLDLVIQLRKQAVYEKGDDTTRRVKEGYGRILVC